MTPHTVSIPESVTKKDVWPVVDPGVSSLEVPQSPGQFL